MSVENIVGKAEIAHYEKFLLFPQCVQELYFRHVKTGLFGKGLNDSICKNLSKM